jgi:hypothetical protein
VIRHYNSLAVRGIKKTVISRLVKKEFGSFGFHYEEAVSILKMLVSVAMN